MRQETSLHRIFNSEPIPSESDNRRNCAVGKSMKRLWIESCPTDIWTECSESWEWCFCSVYDFGKRTTEMWWIALWCLYSGSSEIVWICRGLWRDRTFEILLRFILIVMNSITNLSRLIPILPYAIILVQLMERRRNGLIIAKIWRLLWVLKWRVTYREWSDS